VDRRHFLLTSLAGVLAAPLAAEGQEAGKVPRVGFLVMARNPGVENAFPEGLVQLGYREGRDIAIEWRSADGRQERLPQLAAELLRLGVGVIVAGGPEARIAAMKATSTIPIVAIGGTDPVAEGWAKSLARPGGNVTGLTVTFPDLNTKQVQLLKETIPEVVRVAVLFHSATGASPEIEFITATRNAARALGADIQIIEVRTAADFDGAFRQMIQGRRQAVIVTETAMMFAHRADIAERARRSRLATVGQWRPSADAGYLVSYGADLGDLLRRAAIYVDKILKGARAGDVPIERPTKFELVINLKTAKALGLTIPPSLLLRADQVIE
jgi:putative ABC transport system substrate-binding protein